MHFIYRLPPIDMISGSQTSHQLTMTLLHSEILSVHTLKWNWTKQLQTVVELYCINFILMCGQI